MGRNTKAGEEIRDQLNCRDAIDAEKGIDSS